MNYARADKSRINLIYTEHIYKHKYVQ